MITCTLYFSVFIALEYKFPFLITCTVRYMGHPNRKVARASHSLFVAFVSSEKISDGNERRLLKEQLVFYYMQRSLEVLKVTES